MSLRCEIEFPFHIYCDPKLPLQLPSCVVPPPIPLPVCCHTHTKHTCSEMKGKILERHHFPPIPSSQQHRLHNHHQDIRREAMERKGNNNKYDR